MNSFGRTSDNKSKLRLKGFHRRNIIIKVIKSLFDCDDKPLPVNPGSGSGGNGEVKGSFTYTLEELKATGYYLNTYKGFDTPFLKTFQWTFNKSQLIGKIVLMDGIKYRIIKY